MQNLFGLLSIILVIAILTHTSTGKQLQSLRDKHGYAEKAQPKPAGFKTAVYVEF